MTYDFVDAVDPAALDCSTGLLTCWRCSLLSCDNRKDESDSSQGMSGVHASNLTILSKSYTCSERFRQDYSENV